MDRMWSSVRWKLPLNVRSPGSGDAGLGEDALSLP